MPIVPKYKPQISQGTGTVSAGYSNAGIDGGLTGVQYENKAENVAANMNEQFRKIVVKNLNNTADNILALNNKIEENEVNDKLLTLQSENGKLIDSLKKKYKGVNTKELPSVYNPAYRDLYNKAMKDVPFRKRKKFDLMSKSMKNSSYSHLSKYMMKEQEKASNLNFQAQLKLYLEDAALDPYSKETFDTNRELGGLRIKEYGKTNGLDEETTHVMKLDFTNKLHGRRVVRALTDNMLVEARELLDEGKEEGYLNAKTYGDLDGKWKVKHKEERLSEATLQHGMSENATQLISNVRGDTSLTSTEQLSVIKRALGLYDKIKAADLENDIEGQSRYTNFNDAMSRGDSALAGQIANSSPDPKIAAQYKIIQEKYEAGEVIDTDQDTFDNVLGSIVINPNNITPILRNLSKLNKKDTKYLFEYAGKLKTNMTARNEKVIGYIETITKEILTQMEILNEDGEIKNKDDFIEASQSIRNNLIGLTDKDTYYSLDQMRNAYNEKYGTLEGTYDKDSVLTTTLMDKNKNYKSLFYAFYNMMPSDASKENVNDFSVMLDETFKTATAGNISFPKDVVGQAKFIAEMNNLSLNPDDLERRIRAYNVKNRPLSRYTDKLNVGSMFRGAPIPQLMYNQVFVKTNDKVLASLAERKDATFTPESINNITYANASSGNKKTDNLLYSIEDDLNDIDTPPNFKYVENFEPYNEKMKSFLKQVELGVIANEKDIDNEDPLSVILANTSDLNKSFLKEVSKYSPLVGDSTKLDISAAKHGNIFDANNLNGISLDSSYGSSVYSTLSGTVEYIDRGDGTDDSYLAVKNSGVLVIFGLMDEINLSLNAGDWVPRGFNLGVVGSKNKLVYDIKAFDGKYLKTVNLFNKRGKQ